MGNNYMFSVLQSQASSHGQESAAGRKFWDPDPSQISTVEDYSPLDRNFPARAASLRKTPIWHLHKDPVSLHKSAVRCARPTCIFLISN